MLHAQREKNPYTLCIVLQESVIFLEECTGDSLGYCDKDVMCMCDNHLIVFD